MCIVYLRQVKPKKCAIEDFKIVTPACSNCFTNTRMCSYLNTWKSDKVIESHKQLVFM